MSYCNDQTFIRATLLNLSYAIIAIRTLIKVIVASGSATKGLCTCSGLDFLCL